MNLLLDANVVLDRALKRARHVEVDQLFSLATGDQLSISRFSLHSVAWYMTPRNLAGFQELISDLAGSGVSIVDLSLNELSLALAAMQKYHLDFDDAFNFAVADKLGLTLVSSDADFDRTPLGRLSPADAVQRLASQ